MDEETRRLEAEHSKLKKAISHIKAMLFFLLIGEGIFLLIWLFSPQMYVDGRLFTALLFVEAVILWLLS